MCNIDTDSYCEMWKETTRKARKEHRCDCCRGIISKGQQYISHFSIYDNQIASEKICIDCEGGRSEFSRHHEHWTPSPGYTQELLKECLQERKDFSMMLKWARILKAMKQRRLKAELETKNDDN